MARPADAAGGRTQIGEWLFVAESRLYQQRVIQFVRPEIIVERLEPDTYTVFVHPADERSYDSNRPFTLRVALGRRSAARSATRPSGTS